MRSVKWIRWVWRRVLCIQWVLWVPRNLQILEGSYRSEGSCGPKKDCACNDSCRSKRSGRSKKLRLQKVLLIWWALWIKCVLCIPWLLQIQRIIKWILQIQWKPYILWFLWVRWVPYSYVSDELCGFDRSCKTDASYGSNGFWDPMGHADRGTTVYADPNSEGSCYLMGTAWIGKVSPIRWIS